MLFHGVLASTRRGAGYQAGQFRIGIGTGVDLASGLSSAATGGPQLEGAFNAVLLLTNEDDFDTFASPFLAGRLEGPAYRLGNGYPATAWSHHSPAVRSSSAPN